MSEQKLNIFIFQIPFTVFVIQAFYNVCREKRYLLYARVTE